LRTRHLALCISLLGGAGCIDQAPTSATANALIVHAVLDLGSRDQYVVIQSTTGAIDQQRPVPGAVVTLTTPDGHALLADETIDSTRYIAVTTPRVTTVYRVALDRYGIDLVPGGVYRLRVTTPDGREVRGMTTIPNAVLDTASTTQTIDPGRDTVRLSVPRVAGASAYEVYASWRAKAAFFNDTAVALPAPPDDAFIVTPRLVVVTAVDQNYYDYFRRASDPFTGSGLISHLDGAIGVFGSVVPVLRLQVIVR